MKGRLVWAALALTALSSLGFLLLRHQQPAPISRASLALPGAAKRQSSAADAPRRDVAGPANDELPQAGPTVAAAAAKQDPFGPPRYAPRPAEEWQGMLINLNIAPPCNSSAGCGLARACLGNRCMPCERDEHCANGEACVLQHCIAADLVECRHTAECGADSKCILSGYSREPRGNEGTRSYCNSKFSGTEMVPRDPLPKRQGPLPPLETEGLVGAARAAAAK